MSLDFYLEENYCEHCKRGEEVFWRNITHNLTTMADEAGIYYALWHPDEKGWKQAKDIIPILEEGLKQLMESPEYYQKFNASNGWGMYEHFVPFVQECLEACRECPEAFIRTST